MSPAKSCTWAKAKARRSNAETKEFAPVNLKRLTGAKTRDATGYQGVKPMTPRAQPKWKGGNEAKRAEDDSAKVEDWAAAETA